ncbi:hypothetical protein [Nocardia vulneris]|uniref:Uncharacterized protein n=1 Tax=Nocardia vulneris TaxID=1141657 RepID=A0ABR4ZH27_9NOCA|nr:hypothetical protein [Nocardia vulneris]KIA64702.1 hypothetical protein FG87_12575 [Nocardia vulneris]
MTAQFPDSILFQGDSFDVTAIDGTGLFDPGAHGLEPKWIHTGCYRGYICHYAVVEQRLVLREHHIRTEDEPPRLEGVPPQQDKDGSSCHYRGLDIPVAFTGRLLIGADVIPNRPYLNMGFPPAWLFEQVYELTLRAGELLTAQDCSAAVAATRAEIITTAAKPAPGESTGDWITRTFSRTYDYSWPGRPE